MSGHSRHSETGLQLPIHSYRFLVWDEATNSFLAKFQAVTKENVQVEYQVTLPIQQSGDEIIDMLPLRCSSLLTL